MEPGTAQGIGMHVEYKGVAVAIVELDCRPETVNRQIRQARTGPRVTKVTYVVDDAAIEELRNICRCGTYNRIREAIKAGADNM